MYQAVLQCAVQPDLLPGLGQLLPGPSVFWEHMKFGAARNPAGQQHRQFRFFMGQKAALFVAKRWPKPAYRTN